ncbi:MAG TPA: tRNA pseudouridine(55) synthase TruB [Gemmataceae bacterium]|jgi:tRNA pseudouridine55 synthase
MNVADFSGLLVLDKPGGMTSRAAVDRVQRWFPKRTKIGHAGTLDPLATGVLVLCLGGATRLIEYVQRMKKVYRTTLLLGARSDSDDADGVITPVSGAVAAEQAKVSECVAVFVGELSQVPPAYSAAKVAGQRAYDLARRGEQVELLPHSVRIYGIEILHYAYPYLELEVRCGKGTYIRSLARDIGERLGCGALVQKLRRTRIGPFTTDGALTLDADAQMGRAHLLPPELAVSELPRLVLSENELRRLVQGQAIAAQPQGMRDPTEMAVFDTAGKLFAVAVLDPQRQMLQPVKVFQSKTSE